MIAAALTICLGFTAQCQAEEAERYRKYLVGIQDLLETESFLESPEATKSEDKFVRGVLAEVKAKKEQIADIKKFLTSAEKVVVYRLHPDYREARGKPDTATFGGYLVLAEVEVKEEKERQAVCEATGTMLHWNRFVEGVCFAPRHGLRITSGKRTLEFVICFQCSRAVVSEGENNTSFALGYTAKYTPLHRVLFDQERGLGADVLKK